MLRLACNNILLYSDSFPAIIMLPDVDWLFSNLMHETARPLVSGNKIENDWKHYNKIVIHKIEIHSCHKPRWIWFTCYFPVGVEFFGTRAVGHQYVEKLATDAWRVRDFRSAVQQTSTYFPITKLLLLLQNDKLAETVNVLIKVVDVE